MADFKDYEINLPVKRANKYKGRSPRYNLPIEIGCFSINAESRYCNDGHQMKYLSMPEKLTDLCMDLNNGFHEHIFLAEDTDFDYTSLLKWILSHQDLIRRHFLDQSSNSPKIDFVFGRGLLTTVSSTIYEKIEDWLIRATKFKSIIYLCNYKTERKMEVEESWTEREIRMCSWGGKFEQYMVSDTQDSKPDTSVPVNENEKYLVVLKGKLGHHRLLFDAEMDAVDPVHFSRSSDPNSPLRYVELKTSRLITNNQQDWCFRRHKLLKWYLQSYFGGVPQVICGFRNDEGVVKKLQIFNVRDMPQLAKGLWSPDVCKNFMSSFLDYVKQCVVKEESVYEFYWEPGSNAVTCEELDQEDAFLPEWYTSKVNII